MTDEWYQKRPVKVRAFHMTENVILDRATWPEWLQERHSDEPFENSIYERDDGLFIATLEGEHHVSPGDWVIEGVVGEIYPCKPDIFSQTYERVA